MRRGGGREMRRWEEEEDNDKWGPHVIERTTHIQ
jgi:hypothetical protein